MQHAARRTHHESKTRGGASSGVAAAAPEAGARGALLVEQLGELFEHGTVQLFGTDYRHRAAVIAGHVVADVDRHELNFTEPLERPRRRPCGKAR
jgi:hypothetical protein